MQKGLVVQADVRRNTASGVEVHSFEQWRARKVIDQLLLLKQTPSAADITKVELDVFRDGLGIESQSQEKYFAHTWLKKNDAGNELDLIKEAAAGFNRLIENDPVAKAQIAEALTNNSGDGRQIMKCLTLALVRSQGEADRVLVGFSGHVGNDLNHPNVKFHTALVEMIARAQNVAHNFIVCEYANLSIKDNIWQYYQQLQRQANNGQQPTMAHFTKNCAEFQIVTRIFKETIAKQQPVAVVSAVNLMMRLSDKSKPDIPNVPTVAVTDNLGQQSFIKMALAKCCEECQRIKEPMMDLLAFGNYSVANPNVDVPVSPIASPRFFRKNPAIDRVTVTAIDEYAGKPGSLWEQGVPVIN